MPNLKFTVNADEIAKEFGDLRNEVESAITKGVQQVASMTHAKTQELASQNLKGTRQTYLDALHFEEIQKGIWIVSLDESALWLEEGKEAGSMLPDLLRKNAKTSKSGSRYKVIPFKHDKAPGQVSPSSQMFVNQVKQELKTRKIPFKKLEFNADGSPRIGLLHSIKDISSLKPSASASHGALSGLSIYQRQTPNGSVRRDIMTFRVASSNQEGQKWYHPGITAKKFMDQALEWSQRVFDDEIMPAILANFRDR
jgi:hypothetical protein